MATRTKQYHYTQITTDTLRFSTDWYIRVHMLVQFRRVCHNIVIIFDIFWVKLHSLVQLVVNLGFRLF